jgi:hypothetical protein
MTFVIGSLFVKESRHVRIWDEVGGAEPAVATQAAPVVSPGTAPAS